MRQASSRTGRWLQASLEGVAAWMTLAGLALALAAPARAEVREGMHQVGLDLGLAAPVSKINGMGGRETNGSAGARFGVQYLYHLRPSMGLGFELSNGIRSGKESSALVTGANSTIKGNSVVGMAIGRWTFFDESRLRFFALGGLGLHRSRVTIDSSPQAGLVWADTGTRESRTLFDGSGTGFAFALRGGMEYDVSEPFVAGLDFGYEQMAKATYRATAAAKALGASDTSGSIAHFSFMARVGARFGGAR